VLLEKEMKKETAKRRTKINLRVMWIKIKVIRIPLNLNLLQKEMVSVETIWQLMLIRCSLNRIGKVSNTMETLSTGTITNKTLIKTSRMDAKATSNKREESSSLVNMERTSSTSNSMGKRSSRTEIVTLKDTTRKQATSNSIRDKSTNLIENTLINPIKVIKITRALRETNTNTTSSKSTTTMKLETMNTILSRTIHSSLTMAISKNSNLRVMVLKRANTQVKK
jgi:hypothetical protein